NYLNNIRHVYVEFGWPVQIRCVGALPTTWAALTPQSARAHSAVRGRCVVRPHTPIEVADLAWAFASLCNVLRVPFDARLFLQRFPPPANVGTLSLAADALGLRKRRCTIASGETVLQSAPRLALRSLADGTARVALV